MTEMINRRDFFKKSIGACLTLAAGTPVPRGKKPGSIRRGLEGLRQEPQVRTIPRPLERPIYHERRRRPDRHGEFV